MKITHPAANSINIIIKQLNNEFIFRRGKKLGLEYRYPGLFDKKNFHNLYTLYHDEEFVSFVAVKPLKLKIKFITTNLFSIGCVYTNPKFRRMGLSKNLIKKIVNIYLKKGYEAGILWTTMKSFYESIGWILYDNGVFVKCTGETPLNTKNLQTKVEIIDDFNYAMQEIFRLKLNYNKNYVIRSDSIINAYKVVPSPADQRLILVNYGRGKRLIGYMIFGIRENNIYIYEIVAKNEKERFVLINKLISCYPRDTFYFNLKKNDSIKKKLPNIFKNVEINTQDFQMYYCSNDSIITHIKNTYIPLIDRI